VSTCDRCRCHRAYPRCSRAGPRLDRPADAREYAHEPRATSSPRTKAGTVRRASRAVAPMINRLGPIADAEAVDQRGRLLIAGYAVKRLSASLSPRDRRESGRAVPRGAHRARSALSASSRESAAAARAARETLGLLGRNGEAPSDRSLGASVYRPSPLVGDERKMAPTVGLESTPIDRTSAFPDVLPASGVETMPSYSQVSPVVVRVLDQVSEADNALVKAFAASLKPVLDGAIRDELRRRRGSAEATTPAGPTMRAANATELDPRTFAEAPRRWPETRPRHAGDHREPPGEERRSRGTWEPPSW